MILLFACLENDHKKIVLASEELSLGGIRFTTFDLGGHEQGAFSLVSFYQEIVKVIAANLPISFRFSNVRPLGQFLRSVVNNSETVDRNYPKTPGLHPSYDFVRTTDLSVTEYLVTPHLSLQSFRFC